MTDTRPSFCVKLDLHRDVCIGGCVQRVLGRVLYTPAHFLLQFHGASKSHFPDPSTISAALVSLPPALLTTPVAAAVEIEL